MNRKIVLTLFILLLIPCISAYASSSTTGQSQGIFPQVTQLVNDSSPGHAFSPWTLVRAFACIIVLLGIAWLMSSNRKAISLRLLSFGLILQFLLVVAIIYLPPVQFLFEWMGKLFLKIIDFSNQGARFVFGSLADSTSMGSIFAFQVLPTILFFSALMSLFFYLGIIQKVVGLLAWLLSKTFRISGQESLVVVGNIFLGQNEAPLMVKAYLEKMNRSELFLVMTAGMATIAGGVMAAYIGFLGGTDPALRLYFAKHLLAASVMAAPGAIVVAKLMMPQTEEIQSSFAISDEVKGKNILDSIARGTETGLRLAATVAAMLLVFVAFIWMLNFIFLKIGAWTGLNDFIQSTAGDGSHELSMQYVLAKIFQPLLWLTGVNSHDASLLGRLLGEKLIFTEFIAYVDLAHLRDTGAFVDHKSVVMATYILCGFANFASIGIQIGGIGSLAPSQRINLSRLGPKALVAGTITSLISATMVGMII
ncbi:MAG: nucleoside transporter C-terminal domain-containing protein [Bacteroidales bacterium]